MICHAWTQIHNVDKDHMIHYTQFNSIVIKTIYIAQKHCNQPIMLFLNYQMLDRSLVRQWRSSIAASQVFLL